MIDKYFFEELQYLNEAGKEFAEAFPQQARYLNLEDIDDRDPYVERLFEGFAFLSGRIRQKLDDEWPELTRSLLGLLWPHFLRPIPSLSILEFALKPGTVQKMQLIKRGVNVDSASVGDGITCRFQTCYDVPIRPITLKEVSSHLSHDGNSVITFRFQMDSGVQYQSLGFDNPLRLFLHDLDAPTASLIHLFLTYNVQKVLIQTTGMRSESVSIQGQRGVQPAGFGSEEGLLPYTDQSFIGYRLLQEYFVFRDKFFFFDLCGLDQLQPAEGIEGFEVQIFFNRKFPEGRRVEAKNFRLHCTPIVNLFERDAEPIRVNYLDAEYRVIADVRYPPGSVEVYSVNAVEGITSGTQERHTYVPFYSFKHSLSTDLRRQRNRYYHTSTRPRMQRNVAAGREMRMGEGGVQGLNTYISVVSSDFNAEDLKEETLSLHLTCTNGALPRQLRVGDICYPTPTVPGFVTFSNLSRPTAPIYPPLQGRLEWNLISHLALNYLSLKDRDALRGILSLYDWSKDESNRRRIAGIRRISFEPKEVVYRGSVVRGTHVKLAIESGNFVGEGDLHLFGLVMNAFLSLYASINSFVQLTLEGSSGETFTWPWKSGKTFLL